MPYDSRRPAQEVVSGEFATGSGLTSATAPMILNLFPAGANLTSTGEVVLWGYVCNPMRLLRRSRGTQAMVATLKRPPPGPASRGRRQGRSLGAADGDDKKPFPIIRGTGHKVQGSWQEDQDAYDIRF